MTNQTVGVIALIMALPLVFAMWIVHTARGGRPLNFTATGFGIKVSFNSCPLNLTQNECIRLHGRRTQDKDPKHE